MRAFEARISQALNERQETGLTRTVVPLEQNTGRFLIQDGQRWLNFSSNDYLGLANNSDINRAWQKGIDEYGSGSGASPLVTGQSYAHQVLENTLCEWLDYPAALLFGSGFSANQALLFSLLSKQDYLLQDKFNHASLIEAGTLSPATMKRFKHNDLTHLASQLNKQTAEGETLVVTEGVFSMDGDQAPLSCIETLVKQHEAAWVIDDAHGIGVLGHEGRGSIDAFGVKPDMLVVTFGKALGISGAAILASEDTVEYLQQFARHFVYSTAIPPSQAVALTKAIDIVRNEQWRRDKLLELSHFYHDQCGDIAGVAETNTPIKPIITGDSEVTCQLAQELKSAGVWATAIRPPTVPKGTSRIRFTLSANHEKEDIMLLAKHLSERIGF